jgi:tripartite-type tricarboxylate transporter receptor subunit TctC
MKLNILRGVAALLVAAALIPATCAAQSLAGTRPIKLMVGYSPGGGMDSLARLYASKLPDILKAPVIVENRPGASELLAAQPVIHAPPDGFTLWIGSGGALVQGPGVRTDLPYDPLKDLTPIALIAEGEAVFLVRKEAPVNSMAELIAYAKQNPGKMSYGSAGIGSGSHLTAEYVLALTGANILHVPYKGEAESTRDTIAGNVDLTMAMVATAVPLIKDGKLKPIGITGLQRVASLPDLPTVAESGVPELREVGAYTFYALMGPAGMPPDIVRQLNEAFNKVAQLPEVAQRLRDTSLRPGSGTPEVFRKQIQDDLAKWKKLRGKVKVGTS